jgi:DNA polymerase-1
VTKKFHKCAFCTPLSEEVKVKGLIFDIETDGLDPEVIHCLVTLDTETGRIRRYNHANEGNFYEGLRQLQEAEVLIGHHITGFDLVAIRKLYPEWTTGAEIKDTLVYSRLLWPHLRELDHQKHWGKKIDVTPGSHSLESWGLRLGFEKWTDMTEDKSIFERWSKELEDYCQRDVGVTWRLWQEIQYQDPPKGAVALEHKIAVLMEDMTRHGFMFDRKDAEGMYVLMAKRQYDYELELQEVFPDRVIERFSEKTGKRLKDRVEIFNPGSRKQIAERFIEKGWEPQEFTPDGKPKISETILESLEGCLPEAGVLKSYLVNQKRLGQLAEGKNSLLGLCESDGRIHGKVIANGCISGRMSHHTPNMANVPAEEDFRKLFIVPDDCVLVGCDASGLELRCLAHYMHTWDNGSYARQILEGDIHTQNMEAAGLTDRSQAKTMIYALIYGAGDGRLGAVVGGDMKDGRALRKRFLDRTPALKKLTNAVKSKAKGEGHLIGLDGRKLHCRSQHSALNLLLQSAGALLMKTATCIFSDILAKKRLYKPGDWAIVAHIHDEFQVECLECVSDMVASAAKQSIADAGHAFSFNIPLDATTRIGTNWWETH